MSLLKDNSSFIWRGEVILYMAKKRKVPLRMCLGCREYVDKRQLIRIVRTPEGEITLDFTGKKSGRGAYICPKVECLQKAMKGKRIEKSLEKPLPEDVFVELREKIKE